MDTVPYPRIVRTPNEFSEYHAAIYRAIRLDHLREIRRQSRERSLPYIQAELDEIDRRAAAGNN